MIKRWWCNFWGHKIIFLEPPVKGPSVDLIGSMGIVRLCKRCGKGLTLKWIKSSDEG